MDNYVENIPGHDVTKHVVMYHEKDTSNAFGVNYKMRQKETSKPYWPSMSEIQWPVDSPHEVKCNENTVFMS